jgi:3-oxoacyl-[acyl-carrier protein] reductase
MTPNGERNAAAGGLQGTVVAVTGGASGIGLAICTAFREAGAHLAVLDVDGDLARKAAADLGCLAIEVDVSDSASVGSACEAVVRELGPLDVWVNNAGISDPELTRRVADAGPVRGVGPTAIPSSALALVDDQMWDRMLRIHLDGTFFGTRAAAAQMVPRERGAIINMASICGIAGCATAPHYSAAKAGIIGFTKAVGKELAAKGVRVNVIAPGHVETPLLTLSSEARDLLEGATPLGRLGTPEEIAGAAVFLAEDRAGFFAGSTISPNGGLVTS